MEVELAQETHLEVMVVQLGAQELLVLQVAQGARLEVEQLELAEVPPLGQTLVALEVEVEVDTLATRASQPCISEAVEVVVVQMAMVAVPLEEQDLMEEASSLLQQTHSR